MTERLWKPLSLNHGRTVIVLADTEFGTVDFLAAVRQRSWRAVVGMRCNRKLWDGSDPYSGVYLVRLGRQRWAIEGFFKTIKHRFGLHYFGQSTKLGVYRG
ncbi:hypothetical protein H6F87_02320 [Cyanobacteria bacterium FACHB-502]|uniref:hypothetical protein n=1 Tax=Leptolyngbya sp. GB1-A1 TaxID=2933908 RepID=UPI0019C02E2A|nr:hypothetical protein [Cyanobacteria bacterium FACHB-502]